MLFTRFTLLFHLVLITSLSLFDVKAATVNQVHLVSDPEKLIFKAKGYDKKPVYRGTYERVPEETVKSLRIYLQQEKNEVLVSKRKWGRTRYYVGEESNKGIRITSRRRTGKSSSRRNRELKDYTRPPRGKFLWQNKKGIFKEVNRKSYEDVTENGPAELKKKLKENERILLKRGTKKYYKAKQMDDGNTFKILERYNLEGEKTKTYAMSELPSTGDQNSNPISANDQPKAS